MLRKSSCTALLAAAVLVVVLTSSATAVTVTIDNYLTEPNGDTGGAVGTFAVQSFTPTIAGPGINDTVAANLPYPAGLGLQSVSFLRAVTGTATPGQLFIDVYQGAGDTGTYLGSSSNSIDVNSATGLELLTWNFPVLFMDFTMEHALVWSTDANAGNTVGARLQVARDSGGGFGDSYSGGTADNNGDNSSPSAFDARFEVTMTDNLVDPGSITATIDRGTGNITLTNTTDTSLQNIAGYTILSASGSLTQSGWDKQAVGSQLANDNDQWTVLTGAGVTTDLAESVIITSGDGTGGDLVANTGSWTFGNVWQRSHLEDLSMELIIDDGSIDGLLLTSGVDFALTYAGDPIDPADLDSNGTVNPLDWVEFKNGYGTDVAGMTTFDAYHNSDINLDGVSNQLDFVAYRNLYNAAAGGGSLELAGVAVPEPATWLLVLMGTLAMAFRRNTMTFQRQIRLAGLAVAAAFAIFGSTASAQIPVSIFADDFESYAIADPADFTTGADNWLHNGNGTAPNASRIFQTINFGGTKLWIASAANAAAGSGIDSKNGIAVAANTDYSFEAALVAETNDPARTATGTYDLLIGSSLGSATSVIGGPQAFAARGDDAAGGEDTYEDQLTTQTFNSGAVGVGDRLFISVNFNGADASNPFVGVDNVSINAFAEIGVKVNTSSGEVSFFGDPAFDFDITSYSLTSGLGQLVPGNLASLESQGVGDPAMTPDDGIGFEVVGTPSDIEIAEGDLTGSTTFDGSTAFSLGNVFDTSTLAGDRDLQLTFTNVAGELLTGTVNYFEGVAVPGDYNGNGIVDAADYVRWRDNSGAIDESAFAAGTGNGGGVNATDYTFWKNRFGGTSGSGSLAASSSAVPEPSVAFLAIVGAAGALGLAHRRKRKATGIARCFTWAVTWIVAGAVVGSSALATVRLDREYNLGDDGDTPTAAIGNTVGITWDNAGILNTGDLQDLQAAGNPTYVDVSGRPQANGSTIGVTFDGDGDALSGFLLNRPEQLKAIIDATGPTNPFPHNYNNLPGHGMQLWVNPAASALGSEGSPTTFQSIVADTHLSGGPAINEVGQWTQINSQHFSGPGGFAPVPATVDVAAGDTWYHVMHHHTHNSGDEFRSVLYVDGIAVSANLDSIPFADTGDNLAESVVVGANQIDGDSNSLTLEFANFFTGTIDDLEMYVYGDNTASGGQNYGAFDLFADNEWIAQQIIDTVPGQVLDPGDVNKDGNVDSGDVTAFLAGWRSEKTLPGAHSIVRVGDWLTWDNGDMNHDGITDLRDARILHHGLVAAGAGGLDFSLLGGANVPEPSTCVLAIAGLLAIGGYCRWKR